MHKRSSEPQSWRLILLSGTATDHVTAHLKVHSDIPVITVVRRYADSRPGDRTCHTAHPVRCRSRDIENDISFPHDEGNDNKRKNRANETYRYLSLDADRVLIQSFWFLVLQKVLRARPTQKQSDRIRWNFKLAMTICESLPASCVPRENMRRYVSDVPLLAKSGNKNGVRILSTRLSARRLDSLNCFGPRPMMMF